MTEHVARLWIATAVCFVLFLLLGQVIFGRPQVLWDRRARAFRAQATRLALLLTLSGRTRALAVLYSIAFIVFIAAHFPLRALITCATPSVEACARCAEPKASLT